MMAQQFDQCFGTPVESVQDKIDRLEAELQAAKKDRDLARKLRAESVTPIYRYSIELDTGGYSFEKVRASSGVAVYKLTGTCVNQAECDEVGARVFTGSMSYFYNELSHQIICSVGGGTVFISDSHYRRDEVDDSERAYEELSDFLALNEHGGDVTEIIEAHQRRRQG